MVDFLSAIFVGDKIRAVGRCAHPNCWRDACVRLVGLQINNCWRCPVLVGIVGMGLVRDVCVKAGCPWPNGARRNGGRMSVERCRADERRTCPWTNRRGGWKTVGEWLMWR